MTQKLFYFKYLTVAETEGFLNSIDVPKLCEDQVKPCVEDFTKKDLCKFLKSM